MRIFVNAVAFQDEGRWIAQGVEYDIVVSTDALSNLLEVFQRAVIANVCINAELGRTGLDGIPPAPEQFKMMFEKAERYIGLVDEGDTEKFAYVPAVRLVQLEAS